MKTKRLKNKLLVSLSKQTIADLNHLEMADVRGKEYDGDYNYANPQLIGNDSQECPYPHPTTIHFRPIRSLLGLCPEGC